MSETVTRHRPGTTTDRYGGTVADWTTPDDLDIDGCAVAPRDAEEDRTDGRQAVIHGFTVYTPPGADVRPTDRLTVRGELHEVHGESGVWTSPWSGVTDGVEIRTRRVTG